MSRVVPRRKYRPRLFSNDELIQRAYLADGRIRFRMSFQIGDPDPDPRCKSHKTGRLNRELLKCANIVSFRTPQALWRFLRMLDVLLEDLRLAGDVAPIEAALVDLQEKLRRSQPPPSSGQSAAQPRSWG